MGLAMKTTVELSDELYRRAKAEAALEGRNLKDLVEEALRLVLKAPAGQRVASLSSLMKQARGAIESGLRDLGSNPDHLRDIGRDRRGEQTAVPRPRVARARNSP